jgi:hypothetical protein
MAHDVRVTQVQPTGRPNPRLRQSIGDMVRSLAVVLVVVAGVLLLAWRPQPDPIRVVEVTPAVTRATMQATFDVVAPSGLPDDWRPTSARWEPTEDSGAEPVLHIGYVTPADQYAQFSLSASDAPAYLDEQTGGGSGDGLMAVGGVEWQAWESPERRSLVRIDDGVTTVISGGAAWEELVVLAGSLQPAPALEP